MHGSCRSTEASDSISVMPRCRRQVLFECPLQVCLISEPGLLCNFSN